MSGQSDISKLLFRSEEELRNKMDELNRWEFEYLDEWSFDQGDGRLLLTREDGVKFICPAQIVGSHNEDLGTWMWAWANTSVADSLKADSLAVKRFGELHGFKELTKPVVEMYDRNALQHAALAAHLANAWGVYRGIAGPTKESWLWNALQPSDAEDDGEQSGSPVVYFTFRDVVMRHLDGTEESINFQPDPLYGTEKGELITDPEIARVVHDYTTAIADWAKRCFERDELVDRDEMDDEEASDAARKERREIFNRFCSPSRGRVMTRIAYGSDDLPEEVVRMTRYPDDTVTAVTKPPGSFTKHMAYRLTLENGGYRIYRKYVVYDDGSRDSELGDFDL